MKSEFCRLVNKKIIIITICCIFVNLALFCYLQLNGKSFSQFFAVNACYTEKINEYSDVDVQIVCSELKSKIREESLSDAQVNAYKKLYKQAKYLAEYPSYIDAILENAEQMKTRVIFADTTSFAYRNIIHSSKDYVNLKNIKIQLENTQAFEKFTAYHFFLYFVFGIMLILIYKMFEERENGIWYITRLAPKGRLYLAFYRMVIIAGTAAGILFLFYVTTFLCSGILYGMPQLSTIVQNAESFSDFTYLISKMEYLVVYFFLSWLGLTMISLVLWMLLTIFRNRNVPLVITAIICGIEYILYNMNSTFSVLKKLKMYNVLRIFNINDLLKKYSNIEIWGNILSEKIVFFIIVLATAVLSGTAGMVIAGKIYPNGKSGKIKDIVDLINAKLQIVLEKCPIIIKEIYKLLFTAKGIVVVLFMLVLTMYFVNTSKADFTDIEKNLDEMYLNIGGQDYHEIVELVEEKQADYINAVEEAKQAVLKYQNGEITLEESVREAAKVDYYAAQLRPISELSEKITYLNDLKENTGISGWMISDRGYNQIFGAESKLRETFLMLIMCIGLFLIVSESVILEYKTGMKNINRYTVKGRSWLYKRKVSAVVILAVVMWAVIYLLDYIYLLHMYGMPYLNAPLASLTFMDGNLAGFTIKTWIVLILAVRLFIAVIISLLAMTISKIAAKLNNRAIIILAMAAISVVVMVLHLFPKRTW